MGGKRPPIIRCSHGNARHPFAPGLRGPNAPQPPAFRAGNLPAQHAPLLAPPASTPAPHVKFGGGGGVHGLSLPHNPSVLLHGPSISAKPPALTGDRYNVVAKALPFTWGHQNCVTSGGHLFGCVDTQPRGWIPQREKGPGQRRVVIRSSTKPQPTDCLTGVSRVPA